MKNPWEEISLSDYENHMKHGSVMQLQTLNSMTKEQLESYSVKTAMIFGIAGGNGLDHVKGGMFETLYGVDINADYLNEVQKRYANLGGMLECLHLDLTSESEKLPPADFVIANLLVEYIGYSAFKNAVERANPKYVSCIIQINDDAEKWVSSSPYIHAFDNLGEVHNQMAESELNSAMEEIGYKPSSRKSAAVPGGKKLVRLDYSR